MAGLLSSHRSTCAAVALAVCALAPGAQADLVVDDFEAAAERWGNGVSLSAEHVKEGKSSLRWQADQFAHISRADVPSDWTEYRALDFWLFSEQATDNLLIITMISEDPDTEGGDYFIRTQRIDWTGWRRFELALDSMAPARQPMGWQQIEGLNFHTAGWGQDKPVPGTVLYLDDMKLISRSPEELAAVQERKRREQFGHVTPLNETDDLLEAFARGSRLRQWRITRPDGVGEEACGAEQDWRGVTLWLQTGGRCGYEREYDIDISPYREMLIACRPSKTARLTVRLRIDGEERVEAAGTIAIPLTGQRLEGLSFEIAGDDGEEALRREAAIEWIILRKPERPRLVALSNITRAAMLQWSRPSWGADQYRLYRSREALTAENQGQAEVVAERLSAEALRACDFPPEAGEWHYALAALDGEEAGAVGADLVVTVEDGPAASIRRLAGAVTVDGALDEWRTAPAEAWIAVGGAAHAVSGDPPTSEADLSGKVALAHDDDSLFIAARITDDVVRHTSSRSWEGDGLVLLLRFSPPASGFSNQRYDLVLNYPLATPDAEKPRACVLEDRGRTHPADDKPTAPGDWAVAIGERGYTVEAAIPLAAFAERGFRAEIGGIGLGLSLYDADQETGATTRQTVVSWNQREKLYDPAEAAVVKWGTEE